jgi:hypothetical protein
LGAGGRGVEDHVEVDFVLAAVAPSAGVAAWRLPALSFDERGYCFRCICRR